MVERLYHGSAPLRDDAAHKILSAKLGDHDSAVATRRWVMFCRAECARTGMRGRGRHVYRQRAPPTGTADRRGPGTSDHRFLSVVLGTLGAFFGALFSGAFEDAFGIANTITAFGFLEACCVAFAVVAMWPWRHLKSLDTEGDRPTERWL